MNLTIFNFDFRWLTFNIGWYSDDDFVLLKLDFFEIYNKTWISIFTFQILKFQIYISYNR